MTEPTKPKRKRMPNEDIYNRVRYLPQQLVAARLKVKHLEREAARLGLTDLLEDK